MAVRKNKKWFVKGSFFEREPFFMFVIVGVGEVMFINLIAAQMTDYTVVPYSRCFFTLFPLASLTLKECCERPNVMVLPLLSRG